MLRSTFRRLYNISRNSNNPNRNIVNASSLFDVPQSHIYSKTWTKSELIQYLKENVVYETDNYIVTSIPQGVALKRTSEWIDNVRPLVCETDLNDIIKEIPVIFKSEFALLTKYPKKNASGMLIISKNQEANKILKKNLTLSSSKKILVYKYLAVVLGCPIQTLSEIFALQPVKIDGKYGTEILQKWDKSKNYKTIHYQHEVLASSDFISLVMVEVSDDARDCVRHILASRCLTPVLGDSWNYNKKKSFFFEVPLAVGPSVNKNNFPELDQNLLEKLQLNSNSQKIIPIHIHLQSVRAPMKKTVDFFASVPPPESFVWTCDQLGLPEINYFKKV